MSDGMSIKVECDFSDINKRLGDTRVKDALELITRTIEADMRPYVKRDTGTLEDSAQVASNFRAGEIVYTATQGNGEYASFAYEDPHVAATDTNPHATAHWDEAAMQDRQDEWARLFAETLIGG